MKTVLLTILTSIALSASAQWTNTTQPWTNSTPYLASTWHLGYSNSMDGWKGPVTVSEISADGSRILRVIPIDYKPFNVVTSVWFTNITMPGIIITNIPMSTNVVQAYDHGAYCKANGHVWLAGCGVNCCLVMHGEGPLRHCVICNKIERRELGPWK